MGILSFLERAYFNDSKAKTARAVGLFLFCKKACTQGKSLNTKFRQSLSFKLGHLRPCVDEKLALISAKVLADSDLPWFNALLRNQKGKYGTVHSFHLAVQSFFLLSLKGVPLWVLVKGFLTDAKQSMDQESLPVCFVLDYKTLVFWGQFISASKR